MNSIKNIFLLLLLSSAMPIFAEPIIHGVETHQNRVSFTGRQLSVHDVDALIAVLISDDCIIEELDLSGALHRQTADDADGSAAAIVQFIATRNNTVTKLVLSHNGLRALTASGISLRQPGAQAVKKTVLRELDLSHNQITELGAEHMARTLERSHVLHSLDLSHNALRSDGAVVIANRLAKNGTLLDLNLSNNQIGDVAIPAIVKLMHSKVFETESAAAAAADSVHIDITGGLHHINLSGNNITDDGVILIAQNLQAGSEDPSSLQILNLQGNKYNGVGSAALIRALITPTAIPLDISLLGLFDDIQRQINALRSLRAEKNDLISKEHNESTAKSWLASAGSLIGASKTWAELIAEKETQIDALLQALKHEADALGAVRRQPAAVSGKAPPRK